MKILMVLILGVILLQGCKRRTPPIIPQTITTTTLRTVEAIKQPVEVVCKEVVQLPPKCPVTPVCPVYNPVATPAKASLKARVSAPAILPKTQEIAPPIVNSVNITQHVDMYDKMLDNKIAECNRSVNDFKNTLDNIRKVQQQAQQPHK
jgi:hypothetical protein